MKIFFLTLICFFEICNGQFIDDYFFWNRNMELARSYTSISRTDYIEDDFNELNGINDTVYYPFCGPRNVGEYGGFWDWKRPGSTSHFYDEEDYFCIFPSANFQNNSDPPFLWPYRGKFLGDCEYTDWYKIKYGENCGYFITRSKCFINTVDQPTYENPWNLLPGFYEKMSATSYATNLYYYGYVSPYCHAYPCPSVIYATFPEELHQTYGGFYVIDGVLPRTNPDVAIRQNGMPRYRHLYKPYWFVPLFLKDTRNSNQWNLPMQIRLIQLGQVENRRAGIERTLMVSRMTITQRDINTRVNNQNQPEIARYNCLSKIFSSDLMTTWTIRSHENSTRIGQTIKIEFDDSKGPPIRGECGASYRYSENLAVDTGLKPFVVEIKIHGGGGQVNENDPTCLGTILTMRHVLTAAVCLCQEDVKYDIWNRENCESNDGKPTRLYNNISLQTHWAGRERSLKQVKVWLRNRDPNGREPAGIPQLRQLKYGVGVLWVALHPSYRKETREHNVAVLGLTWPLQFNANLYQICLPSGSYSDSNADPIGGIKYSIKALRKEPPTAGTERIYTNTNGLTIHGECITKTCTRDRLIPGVSTSCRDFWTELRERNPKVVNLFRNQWIEPQSHIKLITYDEGSKDKTPNIEICYDTRATRAGWCFVKPRTRGLQQSETQLWGFCDDASYIHNDGDNTKHKYYEVETTLLPNSECKIDTRQNSLTTKQCTGYIPRKPSVYEIKREKNKYELLRYLGGYYREYLPKTLRRQSRIVYDENGNVKFDPQKPEYHQGFNKGLKICHDDMIDVGGPTYWRLGRLHSEMTADGTRDTTQEPQDNGASIVVLSSIQSGYSAETGKLCDKSEGVYKDEEISILGPGIPEFLRKEISELPFFSRVYDFEHKSFHKVINQKVTTPDTASYTLATTSTHRDDSITFHPPHDAITFSPDDIKFGESKGTDYDDIFIKKKKKNCSTSQLQHGFDWFTMTTWLMGTYLLIRFYM